MISILGFLIAAAVGLTGVGAGSVTAPVLILFFKQGPAAAVGTALVFSFAIKALVAPIYLRRRQVDLPALGALCLGGIPGVVTGALALALLQLYRYQRPILLLVGIMVAGMALYNLQRMVRNPRETSGKDRSALLPWVAALIGAEAGFSSAGTGALGTLLLMRCTRLLPAQVVGTDLCFGLAVSIVGGGWHVSTGDYNSVLLMKLIAGGAPGILAGASLSSILPDRPLRLVLSGLLAALGLQLCFRALW